MKYIVSSCLSGMIIVLGESILNGIILVDEWYFMNEKLGLDEPAAYTLILAVLKLFLLGFIVMYLYELFAQRYGYSIRSGIYAGLFIGILIWAWALSGLLIAGYINLKIAIYTLPWGMVELASSGALGAWCSNKFK